MRSITGCYVVPCKRKAPTACVVGAFYVYTTFQFVPRNMNVALALDAKFNTNPAGDTNPSTVSATVFPTTVTFPKLPNSDLTTYSSPFTPAGSVSVTGAVSYKHLTLPTIYSV